ncbi:type II toxin-antitoxin system RelE/ParE family toxin [Stappia indica]|jgi:proteic killer suppression protein|uniref:Type II toxin-antitoxin system RelE/ParE family toxin n=1 Tax=Stappia indica TaxID=538381 RepID=A0A857C3F3_9HYPH|nr:type II toxin-antitoxin system RelE/ParE family toxin [Stappia indica]QGZ33142.1 type II toxin-antitoxin system RelE/ParE family toxin [Stappia indica]
MIKSFKDERARIIFQGNVPKKFPTEILRIAQRKIAMLNAAISLVDLRIPPGNRLEALKGNRAGQHSIRINDQYRICFIWNDGAENVEITDYH